MQIDCNVEENIDWIEEMRQKHEDNLRIMRIGRRILLSSGL